jgi:WD40 repeat protein
MAWQTPKVDWGDQDGVANTDLNRIEGNTAALYSEVVHTITHSKTGTVHTLVTSLTGQFTAKFNATADFVAGDTWVIGGVTFAATLQNGDVLDTNYFTSGAKGIIVEIDTVNHTLGFKSGGQLPSVWSETVTATVSEAIAKNDAVCLTPSGNWLTAPSVVDISVSAGLCSTLSPDGRFYVVGTVTSPYIYIYVRYNGVFTLLTTPTGVPAATVYSVAFSPDSRYLYIGYGASPYFSVFKRTYNTFEKLTDPVGPPGSVKGLAVSSDGRYIALAHSTDPFITIYVKDENTFTKLATPADVPNNTPQDIAFSSDNKYLVIAGGTSFCFIVYKRTADTFAKVATPATLPSNTCYACSFSPNADYLAIGSSASPYLFIYKRNVDTFTLLTAPTTTPTGQVTALCFQPGSSFLLCVAYAGYISMYSRSGDVFTRGDNVLNLTNSIYNLEFSMNGMYLMTSLPKLVTTTFTYQAKRITTIDSLWPTSLLGMALESKSSGQCRVNLFPTLK